MRDSVLVVVVAMISSLLPPLAVVTTGTRHRYHTAPNGCEWAHETNIGVKLNCLLERINSNTLNFGNKEVENTLSLTVTCTNQLLESTLQNGALSGLRNLRSIEIENCRLHYLNDSAFDGMEQLRNMSIRTHLNKQETLQLSHKSLLHFKLLELLDLGFNNFEKLPKNLFCSLANLKLLNLTHNQLNGFDSLGILDDATGHLCLRELQQLDLSFNRIPHLSETGVASLKNLRALFLHNNLIENVAELSLSALARLKIVDLSNNLLTSISSRTFRESKELTQLNLQNNSLTILQPGLFTGLSKLSLLNLSYNQIGSEEITPDTFTYLLGVVVLDLSHNRLKKIKVTTFQSQYSLQMLYLGNNEIEQIDDRSFANLHNLHTLILSNNRLKSLDAFTMDGLYVLSKLSIDGNDLTTIQEEAFKNCSSLQELNLHYNKLTSVPKSVQSLQKLETLHLNENKISDVRNASYLGLPHLKYLNLSGNQIVNLTRGSLKDLPALLYLDVSRCVLQHLELGVFDDTRGLIALHLQQNQLTDINGQFGNLQKLNVLNLSHNSITWFDYALIPIELLRLDIQNNKIETIGNYYALENILKLKHMNVAFNLIHEIRALSIPNQLQTLIIHNNKISVIHPYTFMAKHNLTVVDLRKNDLSHLDINVLRSYRDEKSENLPTFLISGNPLVCDCNMQWLKEINYGNKSGPYSKIGDLDTVSCKLPFSFEKSHVNPLKANSSDFLCQYQNHCFTLCHCCEFDDCDCEMRCPVNCTCYNDRSWDRHIVDCSTNADTEIPQHLPMQTTELYISGHKKYNLANRFLNSKNLRVIYVNQSSLDRLGNRYFNGPE